MRGFDFLVKYEVVVRRLCRHYGAAMEDDLWDVAVDHIERVVELFDETRGVSFKRYVLDSLRRYMLKSLMRDSCRLSRLEPLYDEHAAEDEAISESDRWDQVYSILGRLSRHDRELLVMHLVLGKTFEEIADSLGCGIGTAHGHYHAALRRARSKSGREEL